MVARAFERAGANQDVLVDEVLKVACGGGARGTGDRNVILSAQAALEALHPFPEDPGEGLFLPLIELTLDPVVEHCFLDQKVDHALCRLLRLQNSVSEIHKPRRNFIVFAAALERLVVRFLVPLDGLRERNQRRLAESLGQSLFGQRARNASVAVFERVDRDKIQMGNTCARKSRKRCVAVRRRIIEPVDEAFHFFFHRRGWRRFEMNLRIADRAGDDLHWLIVCSVGANVF